MSRSGRVFLYFLLLLASVVLIARIAAPHMIRDYVNQAIEDAPGLKGQIGDVDLFLLAGSYSVDDVELYSVDGEQSQPLLKVRTLDLSILWTALFSGKVVTEMHFIQPHIYLLDRPDKDVVENESIKDEDTWINLANDLVPLSIDKLLVIDGTFTFDVQSGEESARFDVTDVTGQIQNLTNRLVSEDAKYADFGFTGSVMGQAPVNVYGKLDPLSNKPTFDVNASMEKLSVIHLDRLVQYYTPVDIEAGQVDFAFEMVAENGKVDGYAKAGIYNLDVFKWREDVEKDGDDPITLFVEGLIGGLGALLENDKKELVATRIPIEGQLSDIETPVMPAIFSLLGNAFIEAIDMKIDDILSIGQSQTRLTAYQPA